jgi:hypothetical protein
VIKKKKIMNKRNKDIKVLTEIINIEEYCSENDITFAWVNERQVRFMKDTLKIDIFPLGKKYHNITDQKRGIYSTLIGFLMVEFI